MATHDLFIGRHAELRRLRQALQEREPLLIWGPPDAGKTALVQRALSEVRGQEGSTRLYVSSGGSLQGLLQSLVRKLAEAGDPLLARKISPQGLSAGDLGRWIKRQTSLRLKGLLYRSSTDREYSIFLDRLAPASQAVARVIQELVWARRTPVYLLARGCTQDQIGRAWSVYWTDRYRLQLGPLPVAEARQLLEICIERFRLARLDLSGFREELLRQSARLPGAIVKMCALAADPGYRQGRRVKTGLVHVDYLLARFPREAAPSP